MTKKLLSIILLSLALTACGNSAEKTPVKETKSQNTKTTEQPTKEIKTEEAVTEDQESVSEQPSETSAQQLDEQHSFAEFIKNVTPSLTEEQSVMEQKSYDFIVKNHTFFPSKNSSKLAKLVDKKITTKHLNKNIDTYLEKFLTITGGVLQIEETETDLGITTIVHVVDEYGNSVMGVYPNNSGDILEDDVVTIIGVPIANYSFDNISGGTTMAQLVALASLTKEE